jgi:hypothetical protein
VGRQGRQGAAPEGENKPEATESEKVATPGKAFPEAQSETPRKTAKI